MGLYLYKVLIRDTFLAFKSIVKTVIFFRVNVYFWTYLLMPWWHINGLVRDPMTLMGQYWGWCVNIFTSQCKKHSSQPSGIREDFWCRCKVMTLHYLFLHLIFFLGGGGRFISEFWGQHLVSSTLVHDFLNTSLAFEPLAWCF